jgi:hypothetical protein
MARRASGSAEVDRIWNRLKSISGRFVATDGAGNDAENKETAPALKGEDCAGGATGAADNDQSRQPEAGQR